MWHRSLLAATVLLLVAPALSGAARNVTAPAAYKMLTLDSPDPQASEEGNFSDRMDAIGDVDGDHVPDVMVAADAQTVNGVAGVGRVYIFSGKTRALITRIDHPEPQAGAGFGFWSAAAGDVNGDGSPDVAIAALNQTVNGKAGQGRVYVFSVKPLKLLYTLDDPDPQAGANFGRTIISPGDLNGDSTPDLVVAASRQDQGAFSRVGRGFAFSGKDGKLLYEILHPDPKTDARLGQAIADPGDINGDGVDDYMLGSHRYDEGAMKTVGRAYVFDGKTGNMLLRLMHPQPQAGAFFGFMDGARGAPGDVNGDGVRDVFVPAFIQDVNGVVGAGRGYLFSGKDGSLIRMLDDPTPQTNGEFGYTYAPAGDVDHDGMPDMIVGQDPHTNPSAPNEGGAYIFSGKTGKMLAQFEPHVQQSTFGASLAAPGDLNGDAHPDFYVGAPLETVSGQTAAGRVRLLLSSDTTAPSRPRVSGPRRTARHRPVFRFSATDRDNAPSELLFRCAFDSRRLHACGARYSQALRRGTHVLRVQARDPAGNRSRFAK